MPHKTPRKARVLDIDPDGKTAEIEFVEEHGELVIADHVLIGPCEATASEAAGAEIRSYSPVAIYHCPTDPERCRPPKTGIQETLGSLGSIQMARMPRSNF